jgi:tRNA pseudouridine synthase 10
MLKDGEESKTKTYYALCVTPGKTVTAEQINVLNTQKLPIVLQQKTPIRVLHRRTLACRSRSILEMEASLVENQKEVFKLCLKTQAGTYVKEFVHGDFGRTTPCVAQLLGIDTDIIALDVMVRQRCPSPSPDILIFIAVHHSNCELYSTGGGTGLAEGNCVD